MWVPVSRTPFQVRSWPLVDFESFDHANLYITNMHSDRMVPFSWRGETATRGEVSQYAATTSAEVPSALCRLGYLGLGEILCFVAFGPLAVTASFLTHALPHAAAGVTAAAYLQANAAAVTPVALSLGLTTTIILFCSHFHQIKGDKQAGKMSPLVRLGTRRGCQVRAPWNACAFRNFLVQAALVLQASRCVSARNRSLHWRNGCL